MTRDLVRVSWQRCAVPWRIAIAAGLVAIGAGTLTWRRAGAAEIVREQRFERASRLRQSELEASARRARAAADTVLVERLAKSPLDASPLDAVAEIRSALAGAGISNPILEAGSPAIAGGISVVTVRLRGPASYRAVRAFLAACEDREVPIGWDRFSFDGATFSAELRILARSET